MMGRRRRFGIRATANPQKRNAATGATQKRKRQEMTMTKTDHLFLTMVMMVSSGHLVLLFISRKTHIVYGKSQLFIFFEV